MAESDTPHQFGKIRVGRITYSGGWSNPTLPPLTVDGEFYHPIVVMMKSHDTSSVKQSPYRYGFSSLSPYILKDENDVIFENYWQFSKIYEEVPPSTQHYSRYDKTVIWSYPHERHAVPAKEGGWIITSTYLNWRKQGFMNPYPVRYPVGYHHRGKCIGAFKSLPDGSYSPLLDYIESRKEIYLMEYVRLVRQHRDLYEIKRMIEAGLNIMIIEVDGPHQESLDYYKDKYNVSDDFIKANSVEATMKNLSILLNDPKHPFGHGYCLAIALQDWYI